MRVLSLFACLLLLSVALAAQQQQQYDPALQNAMRLHQSGELEPAAAAYRAYLKTRPASLEARSNLGAVLASLGRYAEAVTEYKAALKLSPGNPGVSLNLALAYYKSGDMAGAAKELNILHALDPSMEQVLLLLADARIQMGEHKKVISLLEPVYAKQSDNAAVAYLLGTAYARDNQSYNSQKVIEKLFAGREDTAEAKLLVGTTKFYLADFAGALVDLGRAVELNAKLPSANAYHGMALMATGDTGGAAKAFEAELAQNPNDYESHLNLGVILKQDKEYAKAQEHLTKSLQLRPGDIRSRYQLATIAFSENRSEEARKSLEVIVKEAPKFTEAHVTLATVYYRLKLKALGDRERQIVQQLNAEAQDKQPKGEATATPESK